MTSLRGIEIFYFQNNRTDGVKKITTSVMSLSNIFHIIFLVEKIDIRTMNYINNSILFKNLTSEPCTWPNPAPHIVIQALPVQDQE